jgi:hypothetical protein
VSIVYLLDSDAPPGQLGWKIFGLYVPGTRWRPAAPIADADTATTALLRRVTVALSQGTGDSSGYTPKVQQVYFPDRIKLRKARFDGLGPLRAFELTALATASGVERRTYRATFGTTPFTVTFAVTPGRKVDGVDFDVE